MEFQILSTLSFDITFPTPHRFLERYMRMLGEDTTVTIFAYYLVELALVDIRLLQYSSYQLAAAAICLAYRVIS